MTKEWPHKMPAWVTSDQKLHVEETKARAHEHLIEFRRWYRLNSLRGENYVEVEVEQVSEWLTSNRDEILNFLLQ